MPRVNCAIICGDGRDCLTRQCLESFCAHTSDDATLTVLANAVSVETLRLLREFPKADLVVHQESLGGGAVTNRLLDAARTDAPFLYHTASDFYFRPGWLDALLLNWPIAEAAGVGLLGAYSHPYHLTTEVLKGLGGCGIHMKQMVSAGSWFMRWLTWDRFGPLSEEHTGLYVGGEDTAFNFKLIEAGVGRATLVPEVVVHTGRTNSAGRPTIGAECMPDIEGVLIE